MLETPRSSGVLLHPSALPGRFGMGEIGPEAHRWLEYLEQMGQGAWVMPAMTPLDGFAGDPLFLSFDGLRNDGVLLPTDLALLPAFNEERINPAPVAEVRYAFLQLAARRFLRQVEASPVLAHAFDKFCDNEASWLDDWALFSALSHGQRGSPWQQWPRELALREGAALAEAMVQHAAEIEEHKVLQFLLARHWQRLRARAHDVGIVLVGTLPAMVPVESASVWASPHLFTLDANGEQAALARLDANAETRYLPYRWDAHREDHFAWWRARWSAMLRRFDAVQLTEATALDVTWETDLDSVQGCWVHGPGKDLTDAFEHRLADETAFSVVALDEWKASKATLAAASWQSILGEDARDAATWRFTWEAVTTDLQLLVRSNTVKAGRL